MRPLILLAAVMLPLAPARADRLVDEQFWFNFSTTGSIRGRLMGNAEFQPRWRAGGGESSQVLGRVALGWMVSPAVTLWTGYVHSHLPLDAARDANEERVFEQASLTLGKVAGGVLAARTRLEQRRRSTGSGTGWRLRQQVRYVHPLSGPVSGVITAEAMAELADTRWGARKGFEQSRLFVGINVPLTRRLNIEPGYLNQIQNRPRGVTALNHVIQTSMFYRF